MPILKMAGGSSPAWAVGSAHAVTETGEILARLEQGLEPLQQRRPWERAPCVAGFGQATDTHTVHEREDPTDLKAVRLAAQKAFEMAKLTPKDVDVAEESTTFAKYNILVQAGTAMLSQANSSSQSVLRLLG